MLEQVAQDLRYAVRTLSRIPGSTLPAVIRLALGAVGLFGMLSFGVARRTHEMEIRIALGASPSALVRAIIREASVLVVMGLAIGLAGALAVARLLQSELFDLQPTDGATLTGVIATLAATGLLASLLPAWRAAAVDPLVALRAE